MKTYGRKIEKTSNGYRYRGYEVVRNRSGLGRRLFWSILGIPDIYNANFRTLRSALNSIDRRYANQPAP